MEVYLGVCHSVYYNTHRDSQTGNTYNTDHTDIAVVCQSNGYLGGCRRSTYYNVHNITHYIQHTLV